MCSRASSSHNHPPTPPAALDASTSDGEPIPAFGPPSEASSQFALPNPNMGVIELALTGVVASIIGLQLWAAILDPDDRFLPSLGI